MYQLFSHSAPISTHVEQNQKNLEVVIEQLEPKKMELKAEAIFSLFIQPLAEYQLSPSIDGCRNTGVR